jgi:hypothetical protein
MLIDIDTGRAIERIPGRREFDVLRRQVCPVRDRQYPLQNRQWEFVRRTGVRLPDDFAVTPLQYGD